MKIRNHIDSLRSVLSLLLFLFSLLYLSFFSPYFPLISLSSFLLSLSHLFLLFCLLICSSLSASPRYACESLHFISYILSHHASMQWQNEHPLVSTNRYRKPHSLTICEGLVSGLFGIFSPLFLIFLIHRHDCPLIHRILSAISLTFLFLRHTSHSETPP